jgi:threonine dehydrogenase-like Zn-dependent dehydrogenase
VRRARAEPGARTLVIGAGPIGLGTAIFARIAGLDVSLLDMSTERLGFAKGELGFATLDGSQKAAAELVRDATGAEGFDVVFDATGNTASVQSAFAHVAHGGTLVLVSVVKDDIVFSDPEFHKREMTLVGSRNALKADFDHVAASIRNGAVPLAKLVTHRTTLAGTPHDLARWAHEKSGLIKAVIEIA